MSWYARVDDGSGARLVLSRVGDAVSGAVWHPTLGNIEIRPTPERDGAGRRLSQVLRLDPTASYGCGAGPDLEAMDPVGAPVLEAAARPNAGGTSAAGAGAAVRGADDCGCAEDGSVIDIMVVYTPVARTAAGGADAIEAVAMASVASLNTALANSGLEDIQVRLVHLHETDYMETDTEARDYHTGLRSPDDGRMDEVHPLREQHAADLVALLVDSMGGSLAGLGYLAPANPDMGYTVTEWSAAVGPLIFAHEVGHNFGCQHDVLAYDSYPDWYHGYGHKFTPSDGQLRRTVMAYSPGQVVPHFSNPDVLYLGTPTGTPLTSASPRSNAQVIRESARSVANARRAAGSIADCNGNGVDDADDIAAGTSEDGNANGLPDECETRLYVDASAPDGGDGLSWATAFNRLSDALGHPRLLCDYTTEVWVAEGVYVPDGVGGRESTRGDRFFVAPRLRLLGGFAGHETSADQRDPVAHPTVLSGDRLGNDGPGFVNRSDNCYNVVRLLGSGAWIDGFTIVGGNADHQRTDGSPVLYYGAAVNGLWSSGTVSNCVISDNNANAGAVLLSQGPSTVANCLFVGNRVVPIGGLAPAGAGLVFYEGAAGLVVNSTFTGNNATAGVGGAVGVVLDSEAEVRNCLVWGNSAVLGPAFAIISLNGTIPSVLRVGHTLSQGGVAGVFNEGPHTVEWLAGNLDSDPRFVDGPGGDYRLADGSPAIDAGDTSVVPAWLATDLDGHERVSGLAVDLGAYERPACYADFDGDGTLGTADFVAFRAAFLAGEARADCDGSGSLAAGDFACFRGAFLAGCP